MRKIIYLFINTYSTQPLRRRYHRSPYVRRTVETCLCTWAVCSVHLGDTGIFQGKPTRCSSTRQYRLDSQRTHRTGSWEGCKARCRIGTDRHGKPRNLLGKQTIKSKPIGKRKRCPPPPYIDAYIILTAVFFVTVVAAIVLMITFQFRVDALLPI